MAEYTNVEKPFLTKLQALGWQVYDKGQGVPENPRDSFRTSFKEVILKEIFKERITKINPWITPSQLEYCFDRVSNQGTKKLLEANKAVNNMLVKGITLHGKNEVTGEDNPTVRLIDFSLNGDSTLNRNNSFIAINQFRVDTPNTAKVFIIPDIVCFVNGLPIVLIECKDLYVAEPLSDAFTQIRRYSNQRDDYYSSNEGEDRLFHTNLFSVITHGTEARFGTISSDFDYFYNWTDIFPEEYKTISTEPDRIRQEVMIHGMFNHIILLDILRNFIFYTQIHSGTEIKIICRYQQYRAVGKLIERLRNGETWKQRSGVIWHTQGSGKSLTMAFLVKKMRSCFDLKDYKILMIVDRLDLEEQLLETAELAEKPRKIENKPQLVMLSNDTANLNMVMIHKFGVNQEVSVESLLHIGIIPRFETFPEINSSEKILMLIDEAHRSQGGDMADNLFLAFPHATRIGFTGTPLITERHKVKTAERFFQPKDEYIDTYKMNNAVADRATVDIKYIGKSTTDNIEDKELFDLEYEQAFKNRTEEERQVIQQRYGTMIAFLESRDRVQTIAKDILQHYITDILSNGFKAQVVASSIVAAVRYKIELNRLIAEEIAKEEAKPDEDRNDLVLARLRILKAHAIVSGLGNNEPEYITAARREAISDKAVDNFKKDFNIDDPDKKLTGIGILCVCDRLITGFDAPVEQVMYLDKNLREHDLLQAIARVNRTKRSKTHGLVVDYFGVTKNLYTALGIYTDQEIVDNKANLAEFNEYFKDINKEIPELELRYNKVIQHFNAKGIPDFEDFLQQTMEDKREYQLVEEVIELAGDLKFRAEFDILVKNYFDRLDLLFSEAETQRRHWIPAKRIGYLIWRIRYHYKDDTLDLKWASEKVRRLIDKHLQTLGIQQNVAEVSILSPEFPVKINALYRGSKSKASAMEHALRQVIKVNLENSDPVLYRKFKDRIDSIITQYQNNWEQMVVELEELRQEVAAGRPTSESKVKPFQAPFLDLIYAACENDEQNIFDLQLIELSNTIMAILIEGLKINNFWEKSDERIRVQGKIEQNIRFSGASSIESKDKELATDLMKLAKNNQIEILRHRS